LATQSNPAQTPTATPAPPQSDTAPPRVFIVRSALTDKDGNTLVLDVLEADDGTKFLGLAPLKDPTADPTWATQRFKVYRVGGLIQNEYMASLTGEQGGFLHRESMSSPKTRIVFRYAVYPTNDTKNEMGDQGWNFFRGPDPNGKTKPPAANSAGTEPYTIVSEALNDGKLDRPDGVITAPLKRSFRAPSMDATIGLPGMPVVADTPPPPTSWPDSNRLENDWLFHFVYLKGYQFGGN
jgi:hypothetical protein